LLLLLMYAAWCAIAYLPKIAAKKNAEGNDGNKK